ncbi:MAG: DegV family protein [Firmicutes bacterium]|uniref:DegV family protein n=1 Tax=Candidatus Scybalomonas excrementavium TaxID=2840943 RepID=A0A9D9I031_9FIRM|nr:DegV family protein [Candidatus Scybalomonas excrementavium]
MSRIAIVTDSNSGITQDEAKELGVFVIPMPFDIDGETYFEDITLNQTQFYEKLVTGADIATAQPSIDEIMKLWEELLKTHEEVVHIPMSSGLSGSCETALAFSREFDGKVQVVNNQRISVTQRQAVLDACYLVKEGKSVKEIKDILEKEKLESSIYIMLDTLKYLKKGGRITPAAAALGTLLRLKPVLQIQGEKLDAFSKARTAKQAKTIMINAVKKDLEERFSNHCEEGNMMLAIAYTDNEEVAQEFKKEVEEAIPGYDVYLDTLSLSVSCHIGPGALALAAIKKVK